MRIYNFGSLNIDHIYRLRHIVTPGETLAADTLSFAAGGKGLNQSIALAMTGLPTYHAGCLGTDGGMLRDLLEEKGVHLEHLQSVDTVNGHAIIQVSDEGQNSIVIFGGSNHALTPAQVDRTLETLQPGDMVLMQNETTCVSHIARRCQEKGIPLAFNPSPITADLLAEFPFEAVTYLLVNETEAEAITGLQQPEQVADALLAKYPNMRLVMTLGSKGVFYRDSEHQHFQSAFRVSAVDTTGAGDTFTGFFLGLLSQGKSCAEALKYACAASAIAVTRPGAAPSIPTLDEVETFLAQR